MSTTVFNKDLGRQITYKTPLCQFVSREKETVGREKETVGKKETIESKVDLSKFFSDEAFRIETTNKIYELTDKAALILRDIYKNKRLSDATPAIVKLFE